MDEKELHLFVACLKKSPGKKGIFNPWYDVDRSNDEPAEAPEIRRRQLVRYMEERRRSAKFVLVGEAAGYQGAKFSGIPMTSERILLGGKRKLGLLPEHVFRGLEPRRTSRESLKREGFSEPTATIVWDQIVRSGLSPRQFVLRILKILNRGGKVIALGEKAFEALLNLGVEARKVRHPAQGGARKFRDEFMRTIC